MTEYFEVHERDGAARLAELRLADPLETPALVDDVLADAGSEWHTAREVPEGDDAHLTVLPHRGLPGGTPAAVREAFASEYAAVDYPSAAVVTPDTAARTAGAVVVEDGEDAEDPSAPRDPEDPSAPRPDAYVLSNAQELVGHARAFVAGIIRTREAIPADTALYLSGVATPANVATLVSAGVDLVDTHRAAVAGTRGEYLTVEGMHFLEDLEELPCACPACQQPRADFDREDCVEHNERALAAALRTVRQRIRRGTLRDYLEGQARHENWCTAAMRRLDQQYTYLEERTPVLRRATMQAASADSLRRVEIQRFADRVTERYRCRFAEPLLLVPCSARKPYSESQSHGQYHDVVQWRAHTVSMTSPIGVVPQELELTYPAQHYDSVVTGEWSETEIAFVADVLEAYLRENDYPRVIAHVPPDGYREIVERVEERLDIDEEFERDLPFTYTVPDHPTTSESLGNLADALEGELQYSKREREHNTLRAVADYQFGAGAGDALFDDLRTESRYPKLRALDGDGEQLATLVAEYGVLALTLAGARRWVASDAPTKVVEIDDFVPHGSVLAPGVVDASADIRVGDEVVIDGPSAFAVGRARMSGPEMVSSTRGIASQVRHVEEL
ncbi:MAG: archaeosine synthase subunit alpha [Haloarculaceae archaeon]